MLTNTFIPKFFSFFSNILYTFVLVSHREDNIRITVIVFAIIVLNVILIALLSAVRLMLKLTSIMKPNLDKSGNKRGFL